jgi:hypothetical protein
VLHAVRVRGMASAEDVAARAGLPVSQTEDLLLDFEAFGMVARSRFGDSGGWSLTAAGRQHGEALLEQEVQQLDGRAGAQRGYAGFLELNAQFLHAITQWQLGSHGDELLDDLAAITRSVYPLLELVTASTPWFGQYAQRLRLALSMALIGRAEWVDGLEVDSLHRVWFELHEDFLATLGVPR